MDLVDKTILLSLKQDLRILSDIIEDIARSTKDTDIKCWLFPTKDIWFFKQFIEEYKIFQGHKKNVYLELILDRFYVGTHLILRYIDEQIKNFGSVYDKTPFLQKPKQVTLGCSFDNLWKTIQQLVHRMASNKDISGRNASRSESLGILDYSINKSCQTDIVSLNRCDSCASAVSCMRNLLLSLENGHIDNYGSFKKVRPKLYDVTQFGCMLQTTTTIEGGLRNLYKKINEYEIKIEKLAEMNKIMERENAVSQRKATFFEQQNKVYKEKQDKDSKKFQTLTIDNDNLLNELERAKKKIHEQNKLITQHVTSLKTLENNLNKVTADNMNLESCYGSVSTELKSIMRRGDIAQKTMKRIEKETKSISIYLVTADSYVENHNRMLKNSSRISSNTAEKVSNMTSDLKEEFDALFKRFKEFKEQVLEKVAETRSASGGASNFQITGNPAEDISRQIEANNEKIKALQKENQKLSIIVSRFNTN
ncbi:unnamed protein product [Acanthoscelides obtectus]|uniref:Uncharacterized protein n=1 Tax=Acanthoscelides obtectus TaxID=200917 RepID=A0A9P0L4D0_ACAOB|nr:unnamed protein product [Acanthoscelides obtectus]CAK1619814.1 hypothetical protein AOBTE_LOCUS8 [Acanthoscelides obtectus]